MNYLALDLSKKSSGWAFHEEGSARPQHGVWTTIASEYTGRGQLYYQLFRELARLRRVMRFGKIFAEEPVNLIPNSVATTIENIWISVGMGAALELFCYQEGIKLEWVHQARWRREFLGRMPRGTKSVDLKAMAIERCRQLGFSPQRHDDAEALGVLTYGMLREHVPVPWMRDEVLRAALDKAR